MTFPVFASGDVLNASDMNAVGLWLVKTQTIGSAVSSVQVTSAFSSDYENYVIVVSGGVASANGYANLSLGATATGYYLASEYVGYGSTTVTGEVVSNGTSWTNVVGRTTNSLHGVITLTSPNLAKVTHISYFSSQSVTNGSRFVGAGYLNDTTQYTAFTITPSTGTLTGGTIKVYGYRN